MHDLARDASQLSVGRRTIDLAREHLIVQSAELGDRIIVGEPLEYEKPVGLEFGDVSDQLSQFRFECYDAKERALLMGSRSLL